VGPQVPLYLDTCYIPRIFPSTGSSQWSEVQWLRNTLKSTPWRVLQMDPDGNRADPGSQCNLVWPSPTCCILDFVKSCPWLRRELNFGAGKRVWAFRTHVWSCSEPPWLAWPFASSPSKATYKILDAGTSRSTHRYLYLRHNMFDCSQISLIEDVFDIRSNNDQNKKKLLGSHSSLFNHLAWSFKSKIDYVHYLKQNDWSLDD
jgi:hypothetical protein